MYSEDLAFYQAVEQWIINAISNGSVTSFEQLINSLPSVDPIIVFKSLQKLHSSLAIPKNTLEQLINFPEKEPLELTCVNHQKLLPLPHPLDYDWRFNDGTIEYLLQKSAEITPVNGTIALLGVPSLLWTGKKTPYRRKMVLFEGNLTMTNHLSTIKPSSQIVACDLLKDELPNLSVEAVVMDPPWYPEHIRAFLWDACQFCQLGGYILACLPPVGTRPGIEQEWQAILNWAAHLGIQLVQLEERSLSYLTPPFEQNVFRVAGIPAVPKDWRRGNLAIFLRKSMTEVSRPIVTQPEREWLEVSLSNVRIRVRPWIKSEFIDPCLIPIVPNNVLASVSRRDPRRQLADIWTSGNRIFSCQGRGILWHILQAMSKDNLPYNSIETSLGRDLQPKEVNLISSAMEQVLNLVNAERKENLFFEDYWNSTRISFAAS